MKKDDVKARKEHEAVRNSVGYYDFTHELLEVTGPDAGKFLDKVFVGAIGSSKVGDAKYTTMVDEDGIIQDDVIIFRLSEDKFWISTLFIKELIAWLDKYKEGYDVSYEDRTAKTTMYAVQGPKTREVLNDFLKNKVDDMKFFSIEDNAIGDTPVKIARSGYTGEIGYELYCSPEDKDLVEKNLEESGKDYGIMNITTDVIVTSLPREKGYTLLSDLKGTNPIEGGFEWTIDWSKDFVGKEALEKVKEKGPEKSLLGFKLDEDDAEVEPGAAVKKDGEEIGKVTVYTYGFTLEKNIGFALVDNAKAEIGDKVTVCGDKEYETELESRFFYDPDDTRLR